MVPPAAVAAPPRPLFSPRGWSSGLRNASSGGDAGRWAPAAIASLRQRSHMTCRAATTSGASLYIRQFII